MSIQKQIGKVFLSIFTVICLLTGVSLFSLNMYGIYFEDPRVSKYEVGKNDNLLSYSETMSALKTLKNQYHSKKITERVYLEKTNLIIHNRMVNPIDALSRKEKAFQVQWRDNWYLKLIDNFTDKIPEYYEYASHKLALKRGIGLCSQQAHALSSILAEDGFETGHFGGRGHVTTWAQLSDGTLYLLDPDYGISFDSSKDLRKVISEYERKGISQQIADTIKTHYSVSINKLSRRNIKKILIEQQAEFIAWFIPILLLVLSILSYGIKRRCFKV